MKKMLYILMILLGIGTNLFGDWKIVNNTGEDLIMQLCTSLDNSCENFGMLKGKGKSFSFAKQDEYSQPLELSSVTITNADDRSIKKTFDIPPSGQAIAQLGLTKDIRRDGGFSIEGNSRKGYSLSN